MDVPAKEPCAALTAQIYSTRTTREGYPLPALRGSHDAVRGYKEGLLLDPCAYCGMDKDTPKAFGQPGPVLDHIDARARGGEDHWSNFTGACWRCNTSKRDKTLLSYLLYRRWRPLLALAMEIAQELPQEDIEKVKEAIAKVRGDVHHLGKPRGYRGQRLR